MEITHVSPSTNSGVQTQASFYTVSEVMHMGYIHACFLFITFEYKVYTTNKFYNSALVKNIEGIIVIYMSPL